MWGEGKRSQRKWQGLQKTHGDGKKSGAQKNVTVNCGEEYFEVKGIQWNNFFPFYFSSVACLFHSRQFYFSLPVHAVVPLALLAWYPSLSLEDLVCRNWKDVAVHSVICVCLANSTGIKPRLTLANQAMPGNVPESWRPLFAMTFLAWMLATLWPRSGSTVLDDSQIWLGSLCMPRAAPRRQLGG